MGRTHDVVISGFDLDALEHELQAERALADRFGELLEKSKFNLRTGPLKDDCLAAIAAWKEARSE